MTTEQLALVRGWADTRRTLRGWRERPAATVAPWIAGSLAVAALLLVATWVVAVASTPDESPWRLLGVGPVGRWDDYFFILYRNSLVLALHAMACVAGFIAGSSLPGVAEGYSGWWRRVHDRAGRLAIGFVAAATLFSLGTQAYAWQELLAATFVTAAIAVPLLLAAAAVEVWVTPHVLYFLK
jgi:hypothetical protein